MSLQSQSKTFKSEPMGPQVTPKINPKSTSGSNKKTWTVLRTNEPGQLLVFSLRVFLHRVSDRPCFSVRRREAPHRRAVGAALRAAFGAGQRFALPL